MEIIKLNNASELPNEWDYLAENYFQKKDFLRHCQNHNPCFQRYYLFYKNQKLEAGAIVYSLNLNLLSYAKFNLPIKTNLIGIPASVSSAGIFGNTENLIQLKKWIYAHEKGFILALNLNQKPITNSNAHGNTLPSIVYKNTFKNKSDYLNSLRSDYRRRLNIIKLKNKNSKIQTIINSEFTIEMYNQYLEVFKKSSGKLELLSIDYFINLPEQFKINLLILDNKTMGWNIYIIDNETLYFFLGGIDYKLNKKYNSYFYLLNFLLEKGIEQGVKEIDFGQTAEIPKLKMGGIIQEKYMEAQISNKFLNAILSKFSSLLSYNKKFDEFAVFNKKEIKTKQNQF